VTDIQLTLPEDRVENGIGKINEDVNLLKAATAKTADLTNQNLADLRAFVATLQAQINANSNDITTLKGGTVTTPTGAYDLAVVSLSSTPLNPVEGDSVVFSAVVKNVGTAEKPSGVSTQVTFVVDSAATNTSTTASYTQAIPVGQSITLSATGGANGANAYKAVKGAHTVQATVNDTVNGGRNTVDNNVLSGTFQVTGVTTGGTTNTNPTPLNSDGLGFANMILSSDSINDTTAVSVSETIVYDTTRTTPQTLEYGFSVRQVNDAGTVISPDNGDLDMALTAFQTTTSWTGGRATVTGSRVYPAGRYSVTPFYRLQGSSSYVKFANMTLYFSVAATPVSNPGGGTTTPPPASTGTWLSGSSGEMTSQGQFGSFRGLADQVASHWAENSTDFPGLQAGGEYGNWTKSMIIAIGGIPDGGSWSAAASGSYDSQWTAQLNGLKTQWNRLSRGTLWISFAHEMNGNWYSWGNINAGQEASVAAAVKRFAGLKQSIFPAAKLAMVMNRETVTSCDWRKCVPGYTEGQPSTNWIQALGVDYYNQYPPQSTAAQWPSISTETDGAGAPKGIEAHRAFAQSRGVPLIIQEWGGNADNGDYVDYITSMFNFFKSNAGTGAGQIAAEAYFNTLVPEQSYRFFLYNTGRATRLPNSAAKYKQLWSSLAATA